MFRLSTIGTAGLARVTGMVAAATSWKVAGVAAARGMADLPYWDDSSSQLPGWEEEQSRGGGGGYGGGRNGGGAASGRAYGGSGGGDGQPVHNARYALYKATKSEMRGAAVQFSYSFTAKAMFVEGAKQAGDKLSPGASGRQFDWDNKVVIKLSVTELGKMLAVIDGKAPEASFFHSIMPRGDGGGSSGGKIQSKLDFKDNETNYILGISRRTGDQPAQSLGLYVDIGEAQVLRVVLEAAIKDAAGFEPDATVRQSTGQRGAVPTQSRSRLA
ncbi:uncharacterized protein AMSG_10476 [Thecamonas trahens ATCC 50062]|uniref:Uncharacterized protein n=1 Tax=Thecamonas trahens ATCC 50062 TaxID=461836 RepID=A0A0L0DQ88_THETB|nr:hypothetical protein AMSG_10476 [Thecamonas trahens ATCC 50062]KNC54479.1 hypothetical protein AMSG_10476 [Thecamonas trahens ATCC 50062]|eukprot:XP_013753633.1 hypothetical protein AMSG_10476 [Thecamonas trahens ATCC 50062]